jgi:Short C-terminal domain
MTTRYSSRRDGDIRRCFTRGLEQRVVARMADPDTPDCRGKASAAPQVRLTALQAPMPTAAPLSAAAAFSNMPLLGQAPLMAMPGRDTARGPQPPAPQRAAVVATPETSSEERSVGAASQMREITDVLSKLADLRDNGALTDREFNEQKQRLLGGR